MLIETPFEKLLEVAEKLKLKLPIEENKLAKEESSFWDKFQWFIPNEIKNKKGKEHFTAVYSSDMREKYYIIILKSSFSWKTI